MKTLRCVVLGCLALAVLVAGASAEAPAAHASYAVVERGAHHRVWQHVAWATNWLGQVVARTNAYTELATGLHKFQDGQWQEASAVIESFPDGAIARQGQYQVVFASDAATLGAIDLQTPDGKRLRSHLLGLSYYDEVNGKSVMIAEVTNCVGVVVPPNQVLYENAFTGLKASIRYSITLSAFEQDVLILEPPPAPEQFGLDSQTTRLQVITEFLSPPAPVITEDAGEAADALALPDPVVDFGVMKLGRGLAFPAGSSEEPVADTVPVSKRWKQWQGRQFLIEEVKLPAVMQQLEALPVKQASAMGTIRQAAREPQWPKWFVARTEPRQPMQLAKLDSPPRGFVLDYTLVTSETNFTFQSGNTYYVSGTVNLSGTTTIEAAIVKYTNTTSAKLNLLGTVDCQTSTDQPAVFTAKDDDSVGSIITGSTGSPSGYYGLMISGPSAAMAFHDCRFAYANRAITHSGDLYLTNVQFVACSRPIYGQGSDHTITVDNALFYTNGMIFDNGHGTIFCGQHLTVQQAGSIAATSGSVDCSIYLTNCLIAGLTSWGKNVEDSYTNQVAWLSSGAGLFQNVGAGTHYLAESSAYRNVGTTNIAANFLPAIQAMTTYPPPASTVDTNTPDLGYHYPVLTDFDLDGMEDGWEWKHFGTVTNNASGDYDGDGASNSDEYLSGSDPNSITFYTLFAGLRITGATATGMVSVLGGVPAQMAILLDDTNFTAAAWTNYSATFTQHLGPTNGTHELYVGLKGRASDSQETWTGYRLTRDTNAPVVFITNPAPGVVYRPLIQLQGYSVEPLRSIRFDLTNAAGILTNQEGYVVKQVVDPATLEITTNFFECLDLVLTNGTNRVTLHLTDRAGNVTSLVQEYEYAPPTSAPTLSVIWPQPGASVCGTNFTLRARVSDPTATLTAEIIGGSVTNLAAAIVEREGKVWVENLPLADGTNTISLFATNVANITAMTNFTVVKSTLELAMTVPDGSTLNQPFVTIEGTINSAGYKVWVNGVAATNHGDGTWTAELVPVNEGGAAVLEVRAIPTSDNGGNGSGTPNGLSATFDDPGNPTSTAAEDLAAAPDKDSEIVMVHYDRTRSDHKVQRSPFPGACFKQDQKDSIGWGFGKPGTNTFDDCWGWPCAVPIPDYYYEWNRATFDERERGGKETGPSAIGHSTYCGDASLFGVETYTLDKDWIGEFCEIAEATRDRPDAFLTMWKDRRQVRNAHTFYELRTGGKAGSKRRNLFVLTAGVEGVGNPFWQDSIWQGQWEDRSGFDIDPTAVTMDGENLGSDGKLYKVLPDGVSRDITPKAEGYSYYTYAPTQTKHGLELVTPSGNPTNAPAASDRLCFSADAPGVLTVNFLAILTNNGPAWALTNRVRFDADAIPGSTKQWSTNNPEGRPVASGSQLTATLYFINLPTNNSAFGLKMARVKLDGEVHDEKCFWAFYDADAYNYPGCPPWSATLTNHPDWDELSLEEKAALDHNRPPNYFYYYMQTEAAVNSACCNSPMFNYGGSVTQFGLKYNPPTDPLFYYYLESRKERPGKQIGFPGANQGQMLGYIDLFAWAGRHEKSHHNQYHQWWTTGTPPRVWSAQTDGDGDYVPDELEEDMSGDVGGPYDPTKKDTYGGDAHWDDDERHAAKTAVEWTEDDQKESYKDDWARPGKNWPEGQ